MNYRTRVLPFIFIAAVAVNVSSAQTITKPDQTPSRTNQEEKAIIDEGVALHDQGKYDDAITKYKQVLEKNPNNILAIYEMAFSYFAAGKYDESLKTATQGSRFKSSYLPQFYMMIGNSLDELGKTADAISAFKQALEILPDDALIHFNLAATLFNTDAYDEARTHLKTAVQLDPKHASSHYALGQVFAQQEYKFPSTLALLRFLSLEPSTQRSAKALSMIDENFKTGVESKKSKDVQITLPANRPKDEGDFTSYELMMSLAQASKAIPEKANATEIQKQIELFDKLISMMSEMKQTQQGKFVFDYYFPYFVGLKKNEMIAPFTYYIFQSKNDEASQWLKDHPDDVKRFLEWSSAFEFTPSTARP